MVEQKCMLTSSAINFVCNINSSVSGRSIVTNVMGLIVLFYGFVSDALGKPVK